MRREDVCEPRRHFGHVGIGEILTRTRFGKPPYCDLIAMPFFHVPIERFVGDIDPTLPAIDQTSGHGPCRIAAIALFRPDTDIGRPTGPGRQVIAVLCHVLSSHEHPAGSAEIEE
jgi:hypothetical protein